MGDLFFSSDWGKGGGDSSSVGSLGGVGRSLHWALGKVWSLKGEGLYCTNVRVVMG